MADSKTIILGPVKIVTTEVTDNTVIRADKEKVVGISILDCFPPPGSTSEFVRPAAFSPDELSRFLQAGEMADLNALYRLSVGKPPANNDATLDEIAGRLGFKDMPVSYTSDEFKKLVRFTACYKTTIYLRVEFKVFEIKITANRDVSIPGKLFPAGDEIATYRIRQPNRYRFETFHVFNPQCCDKQPEEAPENETTRWFTPFHREQDRFDLFRFDKFKLRYRLRYDLFDDDDDDFFDSKFKIKLKYKW